MMKYFPVMKRLAPYIVAGVVVTTLVGFIIPSALFIIGALLAGILFIKIYLQGGNSYLELDLSLFLSILIISGCVSLLIRVGCILMPDLYTCSHNQLRATTFAVFTFPFLITIAIWVVIRLPAIIRSLIGKR